ncbi:hypothetical protein BTR14_12435 [Rhizobium rhizosphaerae]|uniref:Uncharacterized protein n=1 Tax=Xaviernesmea rhizosphaerae TaxID=1672749 RepID=A0ABX3PCQ4_9HYPH|nr:hypothetical protein [Xaviernesmea rhizosphaerae]OQP86187.1 hypothetical protein BTR14_12435 [Xaviernesmea rhizosphaerae]
MTSTTIKKGDNRISYVLTSLKPGRPQSTFTNVILPNGQVIRHVDEQVHKRALENAARVYKEKS